MINTEFFAICVFFYYNVVFNFTEMKNKKWTELQSLQRARESLALGGAVEDKSLQHKIDALKQDIQREAMFQQDDLAQLGLVNRKEMVRLMQEYSFTIHPRDFPNWRPTQRHIGDINAVANGLTIIATDGLLAYFIFTNEQGQICPICGHVDWFVDGEGKPIEVKPLFSFSRKGGSSKPRKRKTPATVLDKTRELLEKLLGQSK